MIISRSKRLPMRFRKRRRMRNNMSLRMRRSISTPRMTSVINKQTYKQRRNITIRVCASKKPKTKKYRRVPYLSRPPEVLTLNPITCRPISKPLNLASKYKPPRAKNQSSPDLAVEGRVCLNDHTSILGLRHI